MDRVRVGILDSCNSGMKDEFAQYLVSYLNSHLPSTLLHTSLPSHSTHLPSTLPMHVGVHLTISIYLLHCLLYVGVYLTIPIYLLRCFVHVVVYLTIPIYHLHHSNTLLILHILYFPSHPIPIVPNTHPSNYHESHADR